MRALLDTHVLLWFAAGSDQLPARMRTFLEDPDAVLLLSDVSVWEIAVKTSIGKLDLGEPVAAWLQRQEFDMGLVRLPIDRAAVLRVADLPFHHRDPFDRLLIAQALGHDLPMLTVDPKFPAYGVRRPW